MFNDNATSSDTLASFKLPVQLTATKMQLVPQHSGGCVDVTVKGCVASGNCLFPLLTDLQFQTAHVLVKLFSFPLIPCSVSSWLHPSRW